MASFAVPYVTSTPNTWGPPEIDEANPNGAPGNVGKFAALPYAPFGRSDRLGRAADFTGTTRPGGGRHHRRDNMRRQSVEEEESNEDTFQLVDTTKAGPAKRFVNPASKRRQHSQRLRMINARRQQSAGGAAGPGGLDKMPRNVRNTRGGGGGGRGGYQGRGGGGRFGGGYNRVDRQPSVAVQNDWKQVEEIDLGKVNKNLSTSTIAPIPDDIVMCGFLDPYNEAYDKVTARQPVPLKRMERKEFYPVTTTDDPVLEKLAIDEVGQVFITDTSKLPWKHVLTPC